jgi:hypothetical protein
MIKLSKLLEELQNNSIDGYYACTSLEEQICLETYSYLVEFQVDPGNHYDYINGGKGFYTFIDKNGYKHFSRLIKENDRWEIKIGYFDKESNRPVYERPKIYKNLEYDEKVFNTHVHIVINELLPYFFEHELVSEDEKVLYFPALDAPRYRLYRIAINKFVDKSKFVVDSKTLSKDYTIIIRKV